MKRYLNNATKCYFIERNGAFFLDTGDGIEMELAYRPPVERLLAVGVLTEIPNKGLSDTSREAGIEEILEHVSNLFDERIDNGSCAWDMDKVNAINAIRDAMEEYL